jgi:hypothetical protein
MQSPTTSSPRRRRADKRSYLAADLELSLTTEEEDEEEQGSHRHHRRQKLPMTPGRSMPLMPPPLPPPPLPPYRSCSTSNTSSSSSSPSSNSNEATNSNGSCSYSYEDNARPSTSSWFSTEALAAATPILTFRIDPVLPAPPIVVAVPQVNDTFLESHVVQVSRRRCRHCFSTDLNMSSLFFHSSTDSKTFPVC